MKAIAVGDKFTERSRNGYQFERLPDDQAPASECERIRVRVTYPPELKIPPSEFGTEPEWFRQRGMEAVQ